MKNWYKKQGYYLTKAFGYVQRYICNYCMKWFSSQTFSIDYYAKVVINYRELLKKLVSTSNIRDISRDFKVTTSTVANKISRLARQAIAVHEELKGFITKKQDLVADGFESYCVSQYYPNNINLLVCKDSQYLYYTNYVTIRRKGRMRAYQKARRMELEKKYSAPYKGIESYFYDLLYEAAEYQEKFPNQQLTLYTDEKREYAWAMKKHRKISECIDKNKFKHIKISSKKARTRTMPLFAVNYLDRQIRKDCANHVRETVCFAKNVNCLMDRLMIYLMYHNYMKAYREKERRKHEYTHAQEAGIEKKKIQKAMKTVFTRRRFVTLEKVTGFMKNLWNRQLFTPLKNKLEFVPKYAC